MRLMRLGRFCPDLPAGLFFDEDEIRCTYLMSKEKPPTKAPRLNEVIRKIAMLGGFLGRKSDGEPGSESIWIGLSRVRDWYLPLSQFENLGFRNTYG